MMSSSFNNPITQKYWSAIRTLNSYADILGSKSRCSVDVTCVKWDIELIGKRIIKDGGIEDLKKVYNHLDDSTSEIKAVWASL